MSVDAPIDVPVDDLTEWFEGSDEHVHVVCCSKPEFLCRASFHAEAACYDPEDEDLCNVCTDIVDANRCPHPPRRPTHFHCPIVESASGLVTVCQGPI